MAHVKPIKSFFGISQLPVSQPFLLPNAKPLYEAPIAKTINKAEDKFVSEKVIKKYSK